MLRSRKEHVLEPCLFLNSELQFTIKELSCKETTSVTIEPSSKKMEFKNNLIFLLICMSYFVSTHSAKEESKKIRGLEPIEDNIQNKTKIKHRVKRCKSTLKILL